MMMKYKGQEYDSAYLAAMAKINHSTLINRIYTGWSVEEAVETPCEAQYKRGPGKITKTEAERWLNDKRPWQMPQSLKAAMDAYVSGRVGSYLRVHRPIQFNSWFSNEYCKRKLA